MIAGLTKANGRRASRCGGFTLVELIAVLLIVAILAAAAVPALDSVQRSRQVVAARMLLHGLTFARQHAVATGVRTWVVVDVGNQTWRILAENPLAPGRGGAIALSDPGAASELAERLDAGDFGDVRIVSAAFDGAAEVGFDWLGRPLNSTESDLAEAGEIVLSGSHRLTVEVETGHVAYMAP